VAQHAPSLGHMMSSNLLATPDRPGYRYIQHGSRSGK